MGDGLSGECNRALWHGAEFKVVNWGYQHMKVTQRAYQSLRWADFETRPGDWTCGKLLRAWAAALLWTSSRAWYPRKVARASSVSSKIACGVESLLVTLSAQCLQRELRVVQDVSIWNTKMSNGMSKAMLGYVTHNSSQSAYHSCK